MEEELKPCPFCGSEPKDLLQDSVTCPDNMCILFGRIFNITAWNTRPSNEQGEEYPCKDDCVYLEADKEIINHHIDKHIEYDKQIEKLQADVDRWIENHRVKHVKFVKLKEKEKKYIDSIVELDSCVAQLQSNEQGLREFARHVIRQECWACEPLDGCEIQDFAERLGLVAKHTATEEDIDEESDFEIGDIIYKFTDALAPPKCKTEEEVTE